MHWMCLHFLIAKNALPTVGHVVGLFINVEIMLWIYLYFWFLYEERYLRTISEGEIEWWHV